MQLAQGHQLLTTWRGRPGVGPIQILSILRRSPVQKGAVVSGCPFPRYLSPFYYFTELTQWAAGGRDTFNQLNSYIGMRLSCCMSGTLKSNRTIWFVPPKLRCQHPILQSSPSGVGEAPKPPGMQLCLYKTLGASKLPVTSWLRFYFSIVSVLDSAVFHGWPWIESPPCLGFNSLSWFCWCLSSFQRLSFL